MTNPLLQKAIIEFEKLPPEDQNAIAARWLEEIKDEQIWADKFAATTDEQWEKLAALADEDIAEGGVISLDEFLNEVSAE